MSNENERSISVSDIIMRVLIKWKSVLAFAIVGIVLFNGIMLLCDMPSPDFSSVVLNANNYFAGALIGLFVRCVWLVASYLLDGKLHSVDDLKNNYNIPHNVVLIIKRGSRISKYKKFIYKLFLKNHMVSKASETANICIKDILVFSQKNDIRNIAIASSISDEAVVKVINKLCHGLSEKLNVNVCTNANNSVSALEGMSGAQAVVMIEKADASAHFGVDELISKCLRYNLPIVTGVMIKEL